MVSILENAIGAATEALAGVEANAVDTARILRLQRATSALIAAARIEAESIASIREQHRTALGALKEAGAVKTRAEEQIAAVADTLGELEREQWDSIKLTARAILAALTSNSDIELPSTLAEHGPDVAAVQMAIALERSLHDAQTAYIRLRDDERKTEANGGTVAQASAAS